MGIGLGPDAGSAIPGGGVGVRVGVRQGQGTAQVKSGHRSWHRSGSSPARHGTGASTGAGTGEGSSELRRAVRGDDARVHGGGDLGLRELELHVGHGEQQRGARLMA
jgi:hypothetical protein